MALRSWSDGVFTASQSNRVEEARAALDAVLRTGLPSGQTAYDVSTLTVPEGGIEVTEAFVLIVFTDDGDVHLGVRQRTGQDWTVELLAPAEVGGWRRLADITSAVELGKLLPTLDPPEVEETYPAWVQPTGAHDAYAAGDRVSDGGKNWESLVDGNVWEPGVSGWREIV